VSGIPGKRYPNVRVLVTDDDPDLADAVKDLLVRRFGIGRITVANDGAKAIWEIQQASDRGVFFDLVICDWQMPKCSGLQVLQWMRSRGSLAQTPFMFLTAVAEVAPVLQAIESGATDYATKPLTEDVVVKKVGAILARIAS
jgi:DNA-binding response OmpR family regulator